MASDQKQNQQKRGRLSPKPGSYFSVSQLKLYNACPHKWYMKYVLGLKEPEQEYFEVGKFGHDVIDHYFKGKDYNKLIDSHENKTFRAIARHSLNALKEYEKQNGAIKVMESEFEFLTPIYNPHTEKPAMLPMYGFMDVITTDDEIIDWKFLASIPEQNPYLNDEQAIGYASAFLSKYGRLPKRIRFGCFQKMTTQGRLIFHDVEVDIWQVEEFWRNVNSFVKRIKMEEYHRQPSDGCRWCPFKSVCMPFKTGDKLFY